MMNRYEKSSAYIERAKAVTPGAAQTLSKQPVRWPQGAYPAVIERGKGCGVVDLDGHTYIDWIAGLAAMTLGYADDRVDVPAMMEIGHGICRSLPSTLEAEVAERLCEVIPCAESVRFVKTGSEATEAAIRVARMATGRDIILTVRGGYHSWHSWFTATRADHPGVPEDYANMVLQFLYNDLDSFRDMIGPDVAAVIMEPCLYEHPAHGFLEGVKKLCAVNGSLLIFDEMVTGFRWHLGGAQAYFNVTPDLACFGKAMANGWPLACLVGSRELMQHATVVSGTFGGEVASLAACKAVLDIYEEDRVIQQLWMTGQDVIDLFNLTPVMQRLGFSLDGFPVKPRLRVADDPDHRKLSLFLQEMACSGVLLHPSGFNIMQSHTAEAVEATITACAIAGTKIEAGAELHGALCEPNAFRPLPT